jgi:predicted metal-dependent hydrolase
MIDSAGRRFLLKRMDFIQFGNKQINYEIIRANRKKTVAIYVGPAIVTVRAPKRLSEEKIHSLIRKKARWIFDRQERIKRERALHPPKQCVNGESFLYLGKMYRLRVILTKNGADNLCHLRNGHLQVKIGTHLKGNETNDAVRETLTAWYKERVKSKIIERLPRLTRQLGRWPTSIQIKDQKSRWGSCSRNGVVRFNWKIIMAPVPVMDYLIVHELCHLIHQNHSAAYWKEVEAVLPDYKKMRDWLRIHNFIMSSFG